MRRNLAMQSLVPATGTDCATIEMPEKLADILHDGWYAADCGALLLVRTGWHARSWPCEAASVAQREYEIKDIRIPDLDLDEEGERFLPTLARRACGFARAALRLASGSQASPDLVAVVSVGIDADYLSHGATVKFFTMRGDYPNWFDDLERFDSEAMMLLPIEEIGSSTS